MRSLSSNGNGMAPPYPNFPSHAMIRKEEKEITKRLFEGNWIEWLTFYRTACDAGLLKVVKFLCCARLYFSQYGGSPSVERLSPVRPTHPPHPLQLVQLLYLPSLGACVLAGCMLRVGRRDGTSLPFGSGDEINRLRCEKKLSLNRGNEAIFAFSNAAVEDKEEGGVHDYPSSASHCKRNIESEVVGALERKQRSSLPGSSGRPEISASSSSSPATRVPSCSSSSSACLSIAPKENTVKIGGSPRMLAYRSPRLPTRHAIVLVTLLAWSAYFGAGTLRRCKDWNSERALFESALKVCPNGIKTLNNLAVGMLNQEEAGRAEGLLRRAVGVSLNGSSTNDISYGVSWIESMYGSSSCYLFWPCPTNLTLSF